MLPDYSLLPAISPADTVPRMKFFCGSVLVLFASLCRVAAIGFAEKSDTNALWLAEHYTKYEHRIPMRDGVKLFTRVYIPKDDSQAWPIVISRTPYALKPYGADNYQDPLGSFRTLA